MAITIPDEYGYVLLAAASTTFVNVLHWSLTKSCRATAKVKYPTTYASEEAAAKDPKVFRFNCAQRAHANFLENQPSAMINLAIAGLRFPVLAASVGGIWTAFRLMFALHYVYKEPFPVLAGACAGLSAYTLQILAAYTSIKFIMD